MDLQAIEARLRDWYAGRNRELVEQAPADMRALIAEVERLTVEHLEIRIERDNLRERRDYYRKALIKADGEIEAVKKLHRPISAECLGIEEIDSACAGCSGQLPNGRFVGKVVPYPCPTMRALGVTE